MSEEVCLPTGAEAPDGPEQAQEAEDIEIIDDGPPLKDGLSVQEFKEEAGEDEDELAADEGEEADVDEDELVAEEGEEEVEGEVHSTEGEVKEESEAHLAAEDEEKWEEMQIVEESPVKDDLSVGEFKEAETNGHLEHSIEEPKEDPLRRRPARQAPKPSVRQQAVKLKDAWPLNGGRSAAVPSRWRNVSGDYEDADEVVNFHKSNGKPGQDAWPLLNGYQHNSRWCDVQSGVEDDEGAEELGPEEVADLRAANCELLRENLQLQKKLKRADEREKLLSKARMELEEAKKELRRSAAAEERARRQAEEARGYAVKRVEFSQHERGELLQEIERLKEEALSHQECARGLQVELEQIVNDRVGAVERISDLAREAERWKRDSVEQTAKLRRAEQRGQALELNKLQDKAQIVALKEQIEACGVTPATVNGDGGAKAQAVPSPSKGSATASKPPKPSGSSQRKGAKGGGSGASQKLSSDDDELGPPEETLRRQFQVLATLVALIFALAASKWFAS